MKLLNVVAVVLSFTLMACGGSPGDANDSGPSMEGDGGAPEADAGPAAALDAGPSGDAPTGPFPDGSATGFCCMPEEPSSLFCLGVKSVSCDGAYTMPEGGAGMTGPWTCAPGTVGTGCGTEPSPTCEGCVVFGSCLGTVHPCP
jgi:hypothetical protein